MNKEEEQGSAGPTGQTGQTGQDTGANVSTGPAAAATVAPAAAAWYCRPLFWSGFLLAGILAILGWLAWQALQKAEAARLAQEKRLALARDANLAREDFIRQLKLLLQADPCALPAEMARLTPPPGIIWPPLGSDRLPEVVPPDPDQSGQASPVLTLPGQDETGENGPASPGDGAAEPLRLRDKAGQDDDQQKTGTSGQLEHQAKEQQGRVAGHDSGHDSMDADGEKAPGRQPSGRSRTAGQEPGGPETGSDEPDLREADSFGLEPQRPENDARPARPARGIRI